MFEELFPGDDEVACEKPALWFEGDYELIFIAEEGVAALDQKIYKLLNGVLFQGIFLGFEFEFIEECLVV